MRLVEDFPHEEPDDLPERCEEAVKLCLTAYQRRCACRV